MRTARRLWPFWLLLATMLFGSFFNLGIPTIFNSRGGGDLVTIRMTRCCIVVDWHGGNGFTPCPMPFDRNTDAPGVDLLPGYDSYYSVYNNGGYLRIPVWMIFAGVFGVLAAGRTALRSARHRLRHKPNHCKHCGYSLVGLSAAAPCPECGRCP